MGHLLWPDAAPTSSLSLARGGGPPAASSWVHRCVYFQSSLSPPSPPVSRLRFSLLRLLCNRDWMMRMTASQRTQSVRSSGTHRSPTPLTVLHPACSRPEPIHGGGPRARAAGGGARGAARAG